MLNFSLPNGQSLTLPPSSITLPEYRLIITTKIPYKIWTMLQTSVKLNRSPELARWKSRGIPLASLKSSSKKQPSNTRTIQIHHPTIPHSPPLLHQSTFQFKGHYRGKLRERILCTKKGDTIPLSSVSFAKCTFSPQEVINASKQRCDGKQCRTGYMSLISPPPYHTTPYHECVGME